VSETSVAELQKYEEFIRQPVLPENEELARGSP